MTCRPVFVLLISLILADLAYSIPKLGKRPVQKHKPGKKWMRQGLAASVEDPDLAVGIDAGLDYQNNIQHVTEGFSQNEDLQDVVRDVDPYAGQEYMEGNENDYVNDNLGVGDELNSDFYYENGNDGDFGNVVDGNAEMQTSLQNYDDYNDNEMRNYKTRALQAGDIFTAQEMLPIAKKLIKKVPGNGSGKGIISSAFNPKDLADTLFARFFLVMKRIIVLEEKDIPGLDALQTLALSGEVAGLRTSANSITESPANKRGEHLLEENPIRKSHYKLLRKRVYGNRKRRHPKRRLRGKIANKLHRNRKVVVNPARRGIVKNEATQNKKGLTRYLNKPIKRLSNRGNSERKRIARGHYNKGLMRKNQVKPKNSCRWIYKCMDMSNLDTCRLHTDCSEQGKYDGRYIGINLNEDEHTKQLKQFRRAISIDVIDEEVEKILENRYKTLRPQNLKSDEKIESLADYFNNIVVREQIEEYYSSPHPMAADDDLSDRDDKATETYNANAGKDNHEGNLADDEVQVDGEAQVLQEDNQGIGSESTQEVEAADATISAGGEVEPASGDIGMADAALYDEVVPASGDAGAPVSPNEAIVSSQKILPIPDDGDHATEVLKDKRRILPGIIKTTT